MVNEPRPGAGSCRLLLVGPTPSSARIVELNVHLQIPGRGDIDYRTYLRELSRLPVETPLMLEHLKTAEEYDEGRHYIQKVASEIGVMFA